MLLDGSGVSRDNLELLLEYSAEGRKRVKDQLTRLDPTMPQVDFIYTVVETGERKQVRTEEEVKYPEFYHQHAQGASLVVTNSNNSEPAIRDLFLDQGHQIIIVDCR